MLKKLVVSLGTMLLAFGMFFGSEAFAATYVGTGFWATEDGKWDYTFSTTSSERNVELSIYNVYRVNYNNGVKKYQDDLTAASVRLCNASTGNCTAYKKFSPGGVATFTNMIPGQYRVDIIDGYPSYYFEGYVDVFRY
ncbi:hypothetical protein [Staphylospora marina]|uniref:hypothetical protein n=1 Tax=Staphylospora marina TaxID=2490858 RepID=UPI000F5C0057|nr:hypothetical protein [Staphylospora marina]